jgi:hypothetical protein
MGQLPSIGGERARPDGTEGGHARAVDDCDVLVRNTRVSQCKILISHLRPGRPGSKAGGAPHHMAPMPRAASPLLPLLVICDLDFTLWNRPRFRSGPPFVPSADGNCVTSSCGQELCLFRGARDVLQRLEREHIPVAVVSRTHRQQWALEWLQLLTFREERIIADTVVCTVMRDGTKCNHIREVSRRMQVPIEDILCALLSARARMLSSALA